MQKLSVLVNSKDQLKLPQNSMPAKKAAMTPITGYLILAVPSLANHSTLARDRARMASPKSFSALQNKTAWRSHRVIDLDQGSG